MRGLLAALAACLVFVSVAEAEIPSYCGEVVDNLTCVGFTSGWTYRLYLTQGAKLNGCFTFDNGSGESLVLTESNQEVSESFDDLPWITFGGHFGDDFYPFIELVKKAEGYEGYFNAYNFTAGHQMGTIGDGENLFCGSEEQVKAAPMM